MVVVGVSKEESFGSCFIWRANEEPGRGLTGDRGRGGNFVLVNFLACSFIKIKSSENIFYNFCRVLKEQLFSRITEDLWARSPTSPPLIREGGHYELMQLSNDTLYCKYETREVSSSNIRVILKCFSNRLISFLSSFFKKGKLMRMMTAVLKYCFIVAE